jgi:hypothetical protein
MVVHKRGGPEAASCYPHQPNIKIPRKALTPLRRCLGAQGELLTPFL